MSRLIGNEPTPERPEILAPAGDGSCFLAALAAGADNIYVGLKQFSARMQAENFGLTELSRLTDLAHEEGCRVTVAMNTLVKAREIAGAYHLASRLESQAGVDGIIIQDLSMVDVVRQAGFSGSLTLSTLANLTHPEALIQAKRLGVDRVVLPRELSIDEIRRMGEACPDGVVLECFIHGALCYCVSGRCYWSSYLGGKSGLRGRCVQPCRRIYSQGPQVLQQLTTRAQRDARTQGGDGERGQRRQPSDRGRANRSGCEDREDQSRGRTDPRGRTGRAQTGRYFSCQDLSLDVLTKTVTGIPHLVSWKIEGRKKGPHYVYHAVTAYRILRDNPGDNEAKKAAEDILDMALGRPRTRARFLPQRPAVPVDPSGQTSSGLLVGKIGIGPQGPFVKPFIPLLPRDYLRVGVEDENWHTTLPVTRSTPKGGTLLLRIPKHKTPKAGVAVYLIDRRERELQRLLDDWQARLEVMEQRPTRAVEGAPARVRPCGPTRLPNMVVHADLPQGKETRGARKFLSCLWLTPRSAGLSRTVVQRFGWWLPPVVWPAEEEGLRAMVRSLWRSGARAFVCNAPWQVGFFDEAMLRDPAASITAGPFCNIANPATVAVLARMGFTSAIVSPELTEKDFLALPAASPLPLGMVTMGCWPVGISRFGTLGVRLNEPFASPRGEAFWARQYGENTWIYPSWRLNLTAHAQELEKAGYSFFVTLQENVPASLPNVVRPGEFNWSSALL